MLERKRKFQLGQVVTTPGVLEKLSHEEIFSALASHAVGDWGDCCSEDAAANDEAVESGARIFSVYHSQRDVKFWVITEAVRDDRRRASTCVLLPSEY